MEVHFTHFAYFTGHGSPCPRPLANRQRWGPGIGGLFLAFPAIFPASATLVEKHEKQKKNRAGI